MHSDITLPLRTLVSKKKKRYQQQGFDLDLTYVTDRIIAMGFPADRFEAIYRNNINQVAKFLELNHSGNYKIYNLCRERDFDTTKFGGETVRFPFDDHNPPAFSALHECVGDIADWLAAGAAHVVAIHCKAGKGRTGVIVCCAMLSSGVSGDASAALLHYGRSRTLDGHGVTIPSQIRYVFYYDHLLKHRLQYASLPLWLRLVKFEAVPNVGNAEVQFAVFQPNSTSKIHRSETQKVGKHTRVVMFHENVPYPFYDDIKFEFFCRTKIPGSRNLCQCWLNTFFIVNKAATPLPGQDMTKPAERSQEVRNVKRLKNKFQESSSGSFMKNLQSQETIYKIVLYKSEIDKANKDSASKIFPDNFAITFLFSDSPLCPRRFNSELNFGNNTFFGNSGSDSDTMISQLEALWDMNVPRVYNSLN